MRNVSGIRALVAALAVIGLLPPAVMAAEKTVTLGVTSRVGVNSLPFVIAEERGFFKAEGLDVSVVMMQNQVVVKGVLSREVDYGGTFSNFVGAALTGLPVRIVMALMEGSDHVLVTAPSVKTVQDLRGKIVGISSFGGTPHSEALLILRKHGLNPEKDVTFLQIGGSSSRYAALESGSIHGAMLEPPFNKMGRKRGLNELVAFNDVMKIPLAGLATHVDTLRERPTEPVRMVKAILRGMEFIRTQKAEILALMDKGWGIKDADVREGIYADVVELYSRTGIVPDEMMQNVIQMVQDARKTKSTVGLGEIVDWRFARKANEELRGK